MQISSRIESVETCTDSPRVQITATDEPKVRPQAAALTQALRRLSIEVHQTDRELIAQERRNRLMKKLLRSRKKH